MAGTRWALLAGLTDEDQGRVLAAARRRRFSRGEVLFHEGDPGESLHLLQLGRVAVRMSTAAGDVVTLGLLGPGAVFGEMALVRAGRERTATVVALEDAETLTLTRTAFESLRAQHPSVDRLLIDLLAARVDVLSHRLSEALYVGVDRRVVRRLVDAARLYGGLRPGTVVPLTQEDLAGLAGATRPSVNQVLQRLQEQGVVVLHRGRIEIVEPALLVRRAGR